MSTGKKIESFEDLIAWQKSHNLSIEVYKCSSNKEFNNDFDLIRQIRRCAVSISSNIAEGFERSGNKEFINFLTIAKGSCGELCSQLILAKDLGYIENQKALSLINSSREVSRILIGLIKYLKNSNQRGYKFSEPEEVYITSNSELRTSN